MKLELRLYPSQSFHQYKQKASIHGLVCHAYRHQQEFCFSNYTTASKQIGDSSAYSTHDCSLLRHQYKGLTTPQVSMLCVSSMCPSLSVCIKIAPCCEFKNPNMKYKMRYCHHSEFVGTPFTLLSVPSVICWGIQRHDKVRYWF